MADRYLKATGNWNDNNTWAATDDGAAGASFPLQGDNVHFTDMADGLTLTVNASSECIDFVADEANTATVAGSSTLTISGTFTLHANMTWSHTGNLSFTATASKNVTTAGETLAQNVSFNGANGVWVIQDELTVSNLYLYRGTFNSNNQTVNTGVFSDNGQITPKVLTLGSSTLNLTGNWSFPSAGLTITANTSTIKVAGTGAFAGGGKTYNNVELNGSAHTISGSNTFAALTLKADTTQTITFTDGTTQTITTPIVTGSIGKVKTLVGSSTAGWTITKAGSSIVTANYLALSYSEGTPPKTWIAGVYGTDTIGNIGWLFGRDWAEKSGAGWGVIRRRGI